MLMITWQIKYELSKLFSDIRFAYMVSKLTCHVMQSFLQVLIIGGGDGGVAREVCKHPAVKSVVQCELDAVSFLILQTYGDVKTKVNKNSCL